MPSVPTAIDRLPFGRVIAEVRRLTAVEGLSARQVSDRFGLPVDQVLALAGVTTTAATRPTTPPVPAAAAAAVVDEPELHLDGDQPAPAATVAVAADGGRAVVVLAVDELDVDAAYQRELDPGWVRRKSAEFDPALVGVLEISDRGPDVAGSRGTGGRYAVMDGQHRLALIRTAGWTTVACRVHTGLTVADEARLFGRIDTGRRKLTGWDHWRARRAAGDPVVADVEAAIAAAGMRLTAAGGVRTVTSARAAEHLHALGGRPLLAAALRVLADAWGPEQLDHDVLAGVGLVLHHYDRRELPQGRLADALTEVTARQLKARARAAREVFRTTLPRLAATVVVQLVNDTRGHRWPALDPYLVRTATPAAAVPASVTSPPAAAAA